MESGPLLAEQVLEAIRRRDVRVPVIVFARERSDENRRQALRMGARAYVTGWSALFQEIESTLR